MDEYFNGTAYLYLNYTLGEPEDIPGFEDQTDRILVAETSHDRDEWLDLLFANGSITISASICYAAFDFAEIDVRTTSQSNRTESRLEPVFDPATSTYTFKELRYAMGQDRSLSLEKRGILQLEKGPGLAVADESDTYIEHLPLTMFLRNTADLVFPTTQYMDQFDVINSTMTGILSSGGSCLPFKSGCSDCTTVIPNFVIPETMHVSTFHQYRLLQYQLIVVLMTSRLYCGI